MGKIRIGKIVNAVGLKGEVKVYSYAQSPDRFEMLDEVYAGDNKMEIENVRYQKAMVILKLKGIDDRNAAEAAKQTDIFIDEEDLEELPEDTFYIKDVIGLDVVNDKSEKLGTVKDILKNTAQDLYEIKLLNGQTAYVPGVPEFIVDINPKEGFVMIKPAEGLLEVNSKNEN